MIELTNLSGAPFVLNDHLIEMIENIPETKISLTTGKYVLVAEDKSEIVRRIVAYNREIYNNAVRLTD